MSAVGSGCGTSERHVVFGLTAGVILEVAVAMFGEPPAFDISVDGCVSYVAVGATGSLAVPSSSQHLVSANL